MWQKILKHNTGRVTTWQKLIFKGITPCYLKGILAILLKIFSREELHGTPVYLSIFFNNYHVQRHCKSHLGVENRAQDVISSPKFKYFTIWKYNLKDFNCCGKILINTAQAKKSQPFLSSTHVYTIADNQDLYTFFTTEFLVLIPYRDFLREQSGVLATTGLNQKSNNNYSFLISYIDF